MSDITQMVIALVLYFLLDRFVKSYRLRKWLALLLVAVGAVGCVAASQVRILGFDLALSAIFAVALGIGLFLKRRRFEPIG
ncbi:hypothetical protein [Pseudomonas petrae]|uniref:Phage holin family protein n=1 Tax=Pseudomonas petrae TaxID=2912190 RepID=A0ABS9I5N1_9PSED|nr:hypothetical protein [Pseudomonas petrae]MCF7534307.1 hypothetical protein [Pseudomonas petrae]MCF7539651.1 hypothetical protein [Pseudomonas petrae]MCF7543097.1 hypothetical protein [Pseudomonas petrae]MCF7557938.1 hypothetical protein [Pseudomonas petrae]